MKLFIFLLTGLISCNILSAQVSLKVLEKIVTATPAKAKKMLKGFDKESTEPNGTIQWTKETPEVFEVISRVSSSMDTVVNYQFSNSAGFDKLFTDIKKSTNNKIMFDKRDGSIRQIFLENKIFIYSLLIMGSKEKPYKYIVNISRYKPHEPYEKDIINEVKQERN